MTLLISGACQRNPNPDAVTTEALYEQVTLVLREVLDDNRVVATPTLTADQVMGWDSLAQVRLILTIERTFNIDFAVSEITDLQNVGELVEVIRSKLA